MHFQTDFSPLRRCKRCGKLSLSVVKKSLLIRADASLDIGTGHVMRCLALAQEWLDAGGSVTWVAAEMPESLRARLVQERIDLHLISSRRGGSHDAQDTLVHARASESQWVVLDGYIFGKSYQSEIKQAGFKVLVLDDNGETGPWDCDAILNQNLHAPDIDYSSAPAGCQKLLGLPFVLLRRELRMALKSHQPPTDQQTELRLLIMMGGSDPDNMTGRVVEQVLAVESDKPVKLRVILGGANPHRRVVEQCLHGSRFPAEIFQAVGDMSEHYRWANCAITAAGSTCWEVSAFGIPFLPIAVAENQKQIATVMGGIYAEGSDLNLEIRAWISEPRSRQGVDMDGRGTDRVCALWKNGLDIQIGVSKGSWMERYLPALVTAIQEKGHRVHQFSKVEEMRSADVTFLLSFQDLVKKKNRDLSCHTLVVHGSNLPQGRGWSPWVWHILEGKNRLSLTLFEAVAQVDAGAIYLQEIIELQGHELLDEIRKKIGRRTVSLCLDFLRRYPSISAEGKEQVGTPTYYAKRTVDDSCIDMNCPLKEQFELLRVVDNETYPAYFEYRGHRYYLKILKA